MGERPVTLSQLLQEFIGICDRMIWLSGKSWCRRACRRRHSPKKPCRNTKAGADADAVAAGILSGRDGGKKIPLNVLRQLQTELQSVKSMHDLFALEAYCTISPRLIGWIKRLELHEELAFRVGTLNLYNVSMHANWQDAFGYLRHVAESIFP